MKDDEFVLREYRDIYRKYLQDGIIDMDKRMKHPFSFQIYPLETAVPQVNWNVPPSRQTHYWIVLVKKGSAEKSIGLYTFPIRENTLYIVPRRMMHSSRHWSFDCQGYVLLFNVDFFLNNAFPKQHIVGRKVLRSSIRPYLYLDDNQAGHVAEIFDTIFREHKKETAERSEMIAIKILELLIGCDRLFTEAEQIGGDVVFHPVLEKFYKLLDAHFVRERSVGFYAEALHLHPNSLNHVVKSQSGLTAKQSINERVITEAKYLLSQSDLSIKTVSHRLGFDEPNNFSAFFLKQTGVSPGAYRESL
jgi:AraC family transcriptional activator of pobA